MNNIGIIFNFEIRNNVLIVYLGKEIVYCSDINRIIKDTIFKSIELFVFYEICEYRPELGYYQYEFCKCFLNFAKEYNR